MTGLFSLQAVAIEHISQVVAEGFLSITHYRIHHPADGCQPVRRIQHFRTQCTDTCKSCSTIFLCTADRTDNHRACTTAVLDDAVGCYMVKIDHVFYFTWYN